MYIIKKINYILKKEVRRGTHQFKDYGNGRSDFFSLQGKERLLPPLKEGVKGGNFA